MRVKRSCVISIIVGRQPSDAKSRFPASSFTACGGVVVPRDRATASLYTYTPFVLETKGGNRLFDSHLQSVRDRTMAHAIR